MSEQNDVLEWALYYARELDWRVFPSMGKVPAIKDWPNLATTDETQIREWWAQMPNANVSLATGARSGVFAIDVEAEGLASMEEYEQHSVEGLPVTVRSLTGGGGEHMLLRVPHGMVVRNSVKKLLPNVDVRGDGGQVILPPSVHPTTGARYAWADGQSPADLPIAFPNMELLDFMGRAGCTGAEGSRRDTSDIPSFEEMLEGLGEGDRNTLLFRWGCQLRRKFAPHEVEALMRQANAACMPPLDDGELGVILNSVMSQDHSIDNDPRTFAVTSMQRDWARTLGETIEQGDDDDTESAEAWRWAADKPYDATALGSAIRLRDRYHGELRHVDSVGWHKYNGMTWELDEAGADRCVQSVISLVLREAKHHEDDDPQRSDQLLNWYKNSQSASQLDGVRRQARSLEGLNASAMDFDRDPNLLNVRNGVLDLVSCDFRDRRREDLFTKIAPVEYQPDAECPLWEAFIEKIIPDGQTRWYVQKALGYSLTGEMGVKRSVFLLYGHGDNGKSMMLETLYELVFGGAGGENGRSYATLPHPSLIVMKNGEQHDTVRASLRGARFGLSSDVVTKSSRLNEEEIKRIAGGDSLPARFMKKDLFYFKPQIKLWIASNFKPGVSADVSMRSRVAFIPFTYQFTKDEIRDGDEVRAEFRAEASGILNWMLEGLRGFRTEGLQPSSLMESEAEEYFSVNDYVGQFLEAHCEPVPVSGEDGVSLSDLWKKYTLWAKENGATEYSRRPFLNIMDSKTEVQKVSRTGRAGNLYGLRIRVNAYGGLV